MVGKFAESPPKDAVVMLLAGDGPHDRRRRSVYLALVFVPPVAERTHLVDLPVVLAAEYDPSGIVRGTRVAAQRLVDLRIVVCDVCKGLKFLGGKTAKGKFLQPVGATALEELRTKRSRIAADQFAIGAAKRLGVAVPERVQSLFQFFVVHGSLC